MKTNEVRRAMQHVEALQRLRYHREQVKLFNDTGQGAYLGVTFFGEHQDVALALAAAPAILKMLDNLIEEQQDELLLLGVEP